MSNYVNYVNVESTSYALGPLMSTSNGGIVDNKSNTYSQYNNCIIHTNTSTSGASAIDNTAMINTNVHVSSGITVSSATILGGSLAIGGSSEWCTGTTFIGCNTTNGTFLPASNADGNVFAFSLYSDVADEGLLLTGVKNIATGYGTSDCFGWHATATATIKYFNSYATTYTGIAFPDDCIGLYDITIVNSRVYDKFSFVAANRNVVSDHRFVIYSWNDYYYNVNNSDYVGIRIDNNTGQLLLYTQQPVDGPVQITIDYTAMAYDGSDSSSGSGSDSHSGSFSDSSSSSSY